MRCPVSFYRRHVHIVGISKNIFVDLNCHNLSVCFFHSASVTAATGMNDAAVNDHDFILCHMVTGAVNDIVHGSLQHKVDLDLVMPMQRQLALSYGYLVIQNDANRSILDIFNLFLPDLHGHPSFLFFYFFSISAQYIFVTGFSEKNQDPQIKAKIQEDG